MSYHDRDWYAKWRKEQEAANAVDQAPPPNPYRDALRRSHARRSPQKSTTKPSQWHGPSITLGAFLAFLFMFAINGFRIWF